MLLLISTMLHIMCKPIESLAFPQLTQRVVAELRQNNSLLVWQTRMAQAVPDTPRLNKYSSSTCHDQMPGTKQLSPLKTLVDLGYLECGTKLQGC